MPMTIRPAELACLAVTLICPFAIAQQTGGEPAGTGEPAIESSTPLADDGPHFRVVRYPQDATKAIAVVGQTTLTLEDLVRHIEERHSPGFREMLKTQPTFQRYLTSDLMAPWVRQFADLHALRLFVGDDAPDAEALEKAQSEALKASFQDFLTSYAERQQQLGRPAPTQRTVNTLLSRFQLRRGLHAEVQGMLDLLEPGEFNRKELRDFFNANARYFGGQVTIQHLLISHRDGGTGLLLDDKGRARANARVAEVKAQLQPDGSNFESLVRRYSDDTKTAQNGGTLNGIHRFDDRLPATLCRAAWALRDGEMADDVVETPYGWHFVKRIDFNQQVFILFTDDAIPSIEIVMRRAMQERLLFAARDANPIQLLL